MNKNLFIILVIFLVAVTGFILFNQKNRQAVVNETSQKTVSNNSITVVLNELNGSGESGTATLLEKDGKVEVTLNMTGAPSGIVQPSHIHSGNCTNTGSVLYPLEYPVDGKAVTILPISLSELKAQLPLLVNVHKSTVLASVYVSCGEL